MPCLTPKSCHERTGGRHALCGQALRGLGRRDAGGDRLTEDAAESVADTDVGPLEAVLVEAEIHAARQLKHTASLHHLVRPLTHSGPPPPRARARCAGGATPTAPPAATRSSGRSGPTAPTPCTSTLRPASAGEPNTCSTLASMPCSTPRAVPRPLSPPRAVEP